MNPKKWGPDAWKLIHGLSSDPQSDRQTLINFYHSLEHILPCRYCRESYGPFIREIPPNQFEDLLYWSYCLHNKVNDKLRSQGELEEENPSYAEIESKYKSYSLSPHVGWIFVFSVAYNYPEQAGPVLQSAYNQFFTLLDNLTDHSWKFSSCSLAGRDQLIQCLYRSCPISKEKVEATLGKEPIDSQG